MPLQFELSDSEWRSIVNAGDVDEDIRDWVDVQIGRGLDYYAARIRKLELAGNRILDAGCGIGNWSLALARSFHEVHALEITQARLRILAPVANRLDGPILLVRGSIEQLPYVDGFFDAVFCNGVFYLTDYRQSLREFHRVLRPGGALYATFNTHKWWIHLLRERAKNEPVCTYYGGNALISALFRYLDELDFIAVASDDAQACASRKLGRHFGVRSIFRGEMAALCSAYARFCESDRKSPDALALEQAVLDTLASEADRLTRSVSGKFSLVAEIAAELARITAGQVAGIEVDYRRRVARDVLSRLVMRRPDYRIEVQTHSLEPDDVAKELGALGFREIATSWEGTLALQATDAAARPIYSRELGVFEFLARRQSAS
jgi:ubiquinone/menaquinone biosynthesis C-methylase UbiE